LNGELSRGEFEVAIATNGWIRMGMSKQSANLLAQALGREGVITLDDFVIATLRRLIPTSETCAKDCEDQISTCLILMKVF
jgi:hypothetical protein